MNQGDFTENRLLSTGPLFAIIQISLEALYPGYDSFHNESLRINPLQFAWVCFFF